MLGDFNRRLTIPGDVVWTNIDNGQPANANLLAVTDNMPVSCRDNSFTSFIDHIVTDLRATAFVDRSSFRQVTFRQADQAVWDLISDHCPVVVELWVPYGRPPRTRVTRLLRYPARAPGARGRRDPRCCHSNDRSRAVLRTCKGTTWALSSGTACFSGARWSWSH